MRLLSAILPIFFLSLYSLSLTAQESNDVVQFSGKVVQDINGEPVPMPYVNVFVKNSSRGTSTDVTGFFSIVAEKGETVVFSFVGYQTAEYIIPEDLSGNWYTMIQTMTQDTIYLPQTVIYPWPSKDFFEIEFLAMQPDEKLKSAAEQNLSPEILAMIEERTLPDGNEAADFTLRQTSQSYYYNGQIRPQNIFNAMAWKQFIEAWRNGDFKNKKKK